MTNVLYIYESEMPTISLFKEGLRNSSLNENAIIDIVSLKKISASQINSADVAIFIRPTDYLSFLLVRLFKRKNKFVIIFSDDDLYNFPFKTFLERKRTVTFRKVLKRGNVILSSSPRIASKYRDLTLGKRSAVSNTKIDREQVYIREKESTDIIKIVYAAGVNHEELFEKYISPILPDLFEKVGKKISITFIGCHPKISDSCNNVKIFYHPFMSLSEYRELMRKEKFDVGLAPINNDEFSMCKYFNKYLEYAMFGITGLFSNCAPYTYVVENKTNGLLVDFDPQDWYDAILEIVENDELREKCKINAYNHILSKFTEDSVSGELKEQIPEIITYKTNGKKCITTIGLYTRKVLFYLSNFYRFAITSVGMLFRKKDVSLFASIKKHFNYKKTYRCEEKE